MSDPRWAFFTVLLTLTGSSQCATVFFGRSLSHTYSEEKPVEEARGQRVRQPTEGKAAAERFPHAFSKPFYRKFVLELGGG
jgi:hypothetical protein